MNTNDTTHDQQSGEALTGDPEPLRSRLAREVRADLAAVQRTAELVAEARRQDRERVDALEDRRWQEQLDRRDQHELKAAEYRLGYMMRDPDAWGWGLTPARAADTYLAGLLVDDRADDGDALNQLEVEIRNRYGIDVNDLDLGQFEPAQKADRLRIADDPPGHAEVTDQDNVADRVDRPNGLAEREDAIVRMSYALRAALEGDKATAARLFDDAMAGYETSDAVDDSFAFTEQLRDDIHALLDSTPRDAPARGTAPEEAGPPEAQVQLVLDHLRSLHDEAPARPIATGHFLMSDDQWQSGVSELRRRGHVVAEFTWIGDDDAEIADGERCYHLPEVRAAATAEERRGRFEREERVNRAHFDWVNDHPGPGATAAFWASPEAADLDLETPADQSAGEDNHSPTSTVVARGPAAESGDTVPESPDNESRDQLHRTVDANLSAKADGGAAEQTSTELHEPDPKAAIASDHDVGPTTQPPDLELEVAADRASDAGGGADDAETRDAVEAAERAVFELKARRALADQHAHDAEDPGPASYQAADEVDAPDHFDSTRASKAGPVLSAFDD